MNLIDKAIALFDPAKGVKRAQSRQILAAYESAKPNKKRKNPGDNASGDALTAGAGSTLRAQARHLDQNHDLAKGVLTALVNNTVGVSGIGVEPQPLNRDGSVADELAKQISALWEQWTESPETTGEYDWAMTCRLMARSWLRDGEALSKSVIGFVPGLMHSSAVPMSLELLEADHLAEHIDDANKGITQGVQRNAWGRPVAYHLFDSHPGNASYVTGLKTRATPAALVDHLKMVDRIRQARGVSVFASVMGRLNDIKDYEEAERVAARISASMAAFIRKGSPDLYAPPGDDDDDDRSVSIQSGMMFDDLRPGEDVGTIESKRPSPLLMPFRDAMMRAVAAGTSAGYSTIARNYDGSYSAQRQELVEQWKNYEALSAAFIGMFARPVYKRFVQMAITSGAVKVPDGVDPLTLTRADYLTPSMPWIKPTEEARANRMLVDDGFIAPQQVIRGRGGNPRDVLNQRESWQKELEARGLDQPEPDSATD